jgi:zinc transport system substrate-binding protein
LEVKRVKKQVYTFFVGIILLVLIIGVNPGADVRGNADQMAALVTIPPQAFLVKEIAGDRFGVNALVSEDGSPHSASMTPQKMKTVREADIYFRVGTPIGFEVNNLKVFRQENADMPIKNTSKGIVLKSLDEHYGKPDYGNSSDPGDKAIDNHIWLSPANLKQMARNVYDGLKETDPSGKDFYEKNLNGLLEKISGIQTKAEKLLKDFEGRSFLAYHPAWGYLGDEFKIKQVTIQEGGDKPGPQKIQEIAKFAQEHGIETIIASAQFSPSTAKMVADSFGGRVASINPMEKEILEEIVELAKEIALGYSNS